MDERRILDRERSLVTTVYEAVLLLELLLPQLLLLLLQQLGSSAGLLGQQYADGFAVRRGDGVVVMVAAVRR